MTVDAISHRSTTSSRRPGHAVEGNAHIRLGAIVRCEVCGGMRKIFVVPLLPHAQRVVKRGDEIIRVDCLGDEVF